MMINPAHRWIADYLQIEPEQVNSVHAHFIGDGADIKVCVRGDARPDPVKAQLTYLSTSGAEVHMNFDVPLPTEQAAEFRMAIVGTVKG